MNIKENIISDIKTAENNKSEQLIEIECKYGHANILTLQNLMVIIWI